MKTGNKEKNSIFTRWKHRQIIMSVSWNLHDFSKVTAKVIPWGQIKSTNSLHNVGCVQKIELNYCLCFKN